MKIAATIARYLLGLVFLVFGADKFLHLFPQQPLPSGAAGQFVQAMMSSKYMVVVGVFEAAGGLFLLINRYVPIALSLLGPVIVNILLTGLLLDHRGLPAGDRCDDPLVPGLFARTPGICRNLPTRVAALTRTACFA